MSFRDKLKQATHWTAAISSAAAMQVMPVNAQPDNVDRNAPMPSIERPTTEYLDYRVKRGAIVNGETQAERSARWETFRKENGLEATMKAIQKESIDKIEIPNKDEEGYVFETYEPGKSHTFESYYPNGILRSKTGEKGEAAEGYYPDGSKRFDRTADGVETVYHPGGKKGEEKIKETPHQLLEAYDVLDEEGRRTEHHYEVMESLARYSKDGGTYTSRDVKKVDLYNPQTQQVIGTYTLDHWGVSEGRIAQIGFVDETGKMRIMDFPQARKIGDNNYYAPSLSVDQIKEIYHEEQQERSQKQVQQNIISNQVSQR